MRAYRNRVFVVKIGGEVAGDPEALDRGAILETVRTGVSGIGRGEWVLKA